MNIPIGTVCVVVNRTGDVYAEFLGLECTVVKGRGIWDTRSNTGERGTLDGYVVKFATGEDCVAHVR